MKILFVSSGNKNNGVDKIVAAQGLSLAKVGIEVSYFPLFGKGISGYLNNVAKLRHHLRTNDYSLIHAHFGLSGIVTRLASRKHKVLVSFMGDDLLGSPNERGVYTLKSRLLSGINKFFARYLFTYSIVKSHNLARALWSGTTYSVIPNGVSFEVFYPIKKGEARKALGIAEDLPVVLFPADRSRVEKRYDLAKKAMDNLSLSGVRLIQVHGVDQAHLNLYYNASDVILLTSYHEGSPNVIKEAMACNRPIVSTDVGDVRENIGKTDGCFIARSQVLDIVQKINDALKFERTNGRDNIPHLESGVVAKRLSELYRSLVK